MKGRVGGDEKEGGGVDEMKEEIQEMERRKVGLEEMRRKGEGLQETKRRKAELEMRMKGEGLGLCHRVCP